MSKPTKQEEEKLKTEFEIRALIASIDCEIDHASIGTLKQARAALKAVVVVLVPKNEMPNVENEIEEFLASGWETECAQNIHLGLCE